MAFGLRAGDSGFLAGTDFEDGNVPSEGWTIPSDDPNQSLAITANTDTYSGDVPTQWTGSDHTKFLAVKTTFGKPISLDYTQDMSAGAYFDSLVKMTVCDEAPAADYANAKIMVWAQENADGTATSLWVRASAPNGDGWKSQDFECGAFAKADEWHRLTIKAIPDIYKAEGASDYVPGFVVYVDGQAISSMAAQLAPAGLNANAAQFNVFGQLFVSLDQETQNKNNITAVGFDGQGSLDDVTLTKTAPSFAVDYEFFTVQGDNNVVSFKANDETSKDGVVQLKYTAGMTVQLSEIVFAEGYMLAKLSGDTDVECDKDALTFVPSKPNLPGSITSKDAAAEFNGKPYASVDEAVQAANEIDVAGTYTLKLFANADSTITFENGTPEVKIEIDLAGKTVKGDGLSIVVEAGDVTIVDSVGGGKVEAGEDGAVMVAGGALIINAGTYDGLVQIDGGTLSIYDGWFLASINDKDTLAACVVREGYTLVEDGDYLVVAKDGWALYLAEGKNGEFLIEDEDDLIALATHLNEFAAFGSAGVTFKQTADIALTKTWTGIGKYGKDNASKGIDAFKPGAFLGTYDGDNKSITGLKLKSDYAQGTATNKYIGLFFSTYKATIKNLNVGIANYGWDVGKLEKNDIGGGVVVGVAWDSTFENVKTVKGETEDTQTFDGTHAIAGLVGFTTGTVTMKSCVNNLDLNEHRSSSAKVAAFSACNQSNSAKLILEGCVNNGAIKSATGGNVAAFSAYNDGEVTLKDCENTGSITTTSDAKYEFVTSQAAEKVTNLGGNKGLCNLAPISKANANFNFAQNGVYVLDSEVVAGGTYKVMTTGNTPVIELKEEEEITFDQSLATITETGITPAEGCRIEKSGDSVVTYKAVKAGGWNPDADPTVPAADVQGLPDSLKIVSLAQLSKWAQANGVDFNDAGSIIPEAFLLNCENTEAAVEEAKAGFKFTSFDPANPPTAADFAEMGYNGTVTIKNFSDAACTEEAVEGAQLFYKAILTPTPAPEEE